MSRTALTDALRRMHAAYAEAERTGVPVDEVYEAGEERRLTRARFLAGSAAAGATLLAAACAPAPVSTVAKVATHARIAIVGGGLAGVICAYRLHQAGVTADLYEANAGAGGRTWTLRGFFDQGQIGEHGGEFISSEHAAVRKLAAELGLGLEDVRAAQPPDTEEIYYVRGARYSAKEMLRDYGAVYPAIQRAANDAGFPTLYNHHTPAGAALDRISARQWIEAHVPGGTASKLGWLLDLDATTENGGESSDQNALNFIYMLGLLPRNTGHDAFYLVGTDERYHVRGGNDQLARRMAGALPAQSLHFGMPLVALRRRSDGSYRLAFQSQLRTIEAAYDHVVLALPFTALRHVDISAARFSPRKLMSIHTLPMGTNTKMHVQFRARQWYKDGCFGHTYADTGYQQTWEVSRAQPGTDGLLVNYTGGVAGASFKAASFGPAPDPLARRFLSELEPVLPGTASLWNGKAFLSFWTGDPWHRGSYSYWGIGNCTAFVGVERERQGNVHFCGEHTSIGFQGFMNGAVETGEAAAREVLHDLGVAAHAA